MRLWADVYDLAGNRLGDGPIRSLEQALVSRVLDGAGTVGFSVPLNDARAVRLLQNECRVRIYFDNGVMTREIGRGVVRNRQLHSDSAAGLLSLDGPDELDTLKRYNTLLARIYTMQPASSIASDLAALAGWGAVTSGGAADVTARFDGASVLAALQELAAHQGLHLRLGVTPNTVEIGAFGESSGLRLVNPGRLPMDAYTNTNIAVIDDLTLVQNSEAICNQLVPLGAGQGEAALTLQHATRSSPYPIFTTMINGKLHYYLVDTASLAQYGAIQSVGVFSSIAPVSNSDADLQNAANALYDAAAAWLARSAVRLDTYTCTVRKADVTLRPGQKVRLVYTGIVTTPDGVPFQPIDVDADFWVMQATERIELETRVVELTLGSIDRVQADATTLILGALQSITIQNVRVQTYPNIRSIVWWRQMDSTHVADVPVLLTNRTTVLNEALVNFTTRPFRATAKLAAAGGDHRHLVAHSLGSFVTTPTTVAQFQVAVDAIGTLATQDFAIATGDWYTYAGSGTHTHALTYGITDDTVYPDTISLYVDGVDQTATLGGPWGVGGGAVDVTVDITAILIAAAGGLRSKHVVEFRCASGQGEVEVTVSLYETIQAIA